MMPQRNDLLPVSWLPGILVEHTRRYPLWQEQDVYKLLHQACLGNGHAIGVADLAREWLEQEALHLSTSREDPLLEVIDPDGVILRVQLRPYVAATSSLEPLLTAFVRTAELFHGSQQRLNACGKVTAEAAAECGLPFTGAAFLEFMNQMEAQGFPAVHHSQIYARQYQPAYRVVARECLEPVLSACGITAFQ